MSPQGKTLEGLAEGIAFKTKIMPNGESRSRVSHPKSGLSAGITSTRESPGAHGWQNSHRHNSGMSETYVVQEGWIVLARLDQPSGTVLYSRYKAGSQFTLSDNDAHNIYVGHNTVFACVKHGSTEGRSDWTAAPDLDSLVKGLVESDFLPLCFPH